MKRTQLNSWLKLLQPGISVKRWLLLLAFGLLILGVGFAQVFAIIFQDQAIPDAIYYLTLGFLPPLWRAGVAGTLGLCSVLIALYELNHSIVRPIVANSPKSLLEIVTEHQRRQRGLAVVAIGGGSGLPSVLRGMKQHTQNITAIVTMADDGGSSGRLRRELGVPPPGDLRNNIAALSNDEDMMSRLFQYRFGEGELGGHSLGNLLLTALVNITGSMDQAALEAARVLAITGRVIPSTLHNVNLGADIRQANGKLVRVQGESQIPEVPGKIERVFLEPANAKALPDAIRAILEADLVVIGPGSLYTSILPNLLVRGIVEALKTTRALVVYVCNIAEQPGETDGYTVAEHVEAIEQHVGRGIVQVILANNAHPPLRRGDATRYVQVAPTQHTIHNHYQVVMTDLGDSERPWRHDPQKLVQNLLRIRTEWENEKTVPLRTA